MEDAIDTRSDEELMQLVQAGNQEAFGTLFARYQGPVWSFLVRRTRDRELTAELYQEVFLRVWRFAASFDASQSLRPWLFRIAANAARDRFRREQRRVDTIPHDEGIAGDLFWRPEGAGNPHPLDGLDLERAIAELPDTLREAFLLGAVEGLDHNEVAAALDITPANARRRISRARARLREQLAASGVTP
jgi:RNA polymerase sigma-70 factor, ECF subfamily